MGVFKGGAAETEVLPQWRPSPAARRTFTVENLHLLLLHTFSADEAHRKHAEGQLEQLVGAPGAPVLLLQIVAHHEQVQREVRQASAIAFKNMIKRGGTRTRSRGAGSAATGRRRHPEDKVNRRHALLETLMAEPDTSIARSSLSA